LDDIEKGEELTFDYGFDPRHDTAVGVKMPETDKPRVKRI
jgi:SET domain-containing protein